MLLLGTKNSASQTVLANGLINMGATYRKYCKKNCSGTPAFTNNGTSLSLNHSGMYHLTATLVGSGTVAGDVTAQLLINGNIVPAAFSSQTITTATTELRTFVIDYYVLVDNTCVLGQTATTPAVITLQNTGVGATFTAVTVNVDKVL